MTFGQTPIEELIPALRKCAQDAKDRVAQFEDYITKLEAEDLSDITRWLADEHYGSMQARRFAESLRDLQANDGSTHGRHVREANQAILAAYGYAQRLDATGEVIA